MTEDATHRNPVIHKPVRHSEDVELQVADNGRTCTVASRPTGMTYDTFMPPSQKHK